MTVNKRFVLLCFFMTSGLLFLNTSLVNGIMCPINGDRTTAIHGGVRTTSSRVIGIHLGNLYSSVAVYKHPGAEDMLYCPPGRHNCGPSFFYDAIEAVENEHGITTTPSCVSFTDGSGVLVGQAAKDLEPVHPERTICGVNRLIGRRFDDPEVQSYINTLPYKVVNKDNKPHIEVQFNEGETKLYSPEEICAMILRKMKEIAEKYMGSEVTIAVVLIHESYYNREVRRQIHEAGKMAGLDKPIVGQSKCAVQLIKDLFRGKEYFRVLFFHLGGTAFITKILDLDMHMFEDIASKEDANFGGQTFDTRLVDYFVDLIKNKYGKDISNDLNALRKLRIECEKAKISLSDSYQSMIKLEFSLADDEMFVIEEPLTRETFEELNMDLFNRTIDMVKAAFEEGKIQKTDIDQIILVGRSSQIPMIQHLLRNYMGKDSLSFVKPKDALLFAATSMAGDMIMVHDHVGTSPTTPISVGIETRGTIMTRFMDIDNAYLPHTVRREVTTYYDGQTTIVIEVFEGERYFTKYCHYLGNLQISNLPPAPRGVTKVEVTLEVHADGQILVTAEHKPTQNKQSMIIAKEERNSLEKIYQDNLDFEKKHKQDIEVFGYISDFFRLYGPPQPRSLGFAAVMSYKI